VTQHGHMVEARRRPNRLAAAIAAALLAGGASADTFTVTSNADAGTGTLRDAVTAANQNPGADTIEFIPGLGEIVLQSQINISDELTLSGPAGARQVIRGSGAERLLAVPSTGVPLTLSRVELAGGRTFNPGGYAPDCFDAYYGDGNGGALCALGDVTITDSVIRDNRTFGDSARGGGLFIAGNAVIGNSTISDNATSDGPARGGGLLVGGDLVMRDSRVTGNTAAGDFAAGGGIAVNGSASIYNSVIAGNATTGNDADGGGLAGSAVDLIDSTLAGNSATGEGGGLRVFGTTTVINSTLSGNSAEGPEGRGGGIAAVGANLLVANSTITANSAAAGGGGIDSRAIETFTYALVLDSSVLAGNTGPSGNLRADPGAGDVPVRAERSVFGDPPVELTDGNTANVFTDATGLEALADNGCAVPAGATPDAACAPTLRPLPDSPVIDAGGNTLALDYDQRGAGFPRTRGVATDIGAFEADLPPVPMPAALVLDKTDGDVVTAPGERLVWTVRWDNIGERAAEAVELRETVPAGTSFDADVSEAWVCDDITAGSSCVLDLGRVDAGSGGQARFAVQVDADLDESVTAIVNQSGLSGLDVDAQPAIELSAEAIDDTPVIRLGRAPVPARGATGAGTRSLFGDFAEPGTRPQLGLEVAGLGDFDGDGRSDVAIGAPGRDAVQIVLGGPFPDDAEPVPLSALPDAALPGFRIQAEDGFGGLGDRLAGAGDPNGDGLADLLLGDATASFDVLAGRGRGAFLQPGFADTPAPIEAAGGRFAPDQGVVLVNVAGDNPFASRLGGGGDFDGDGLDDLLVNSRDRGGTETLRVLFGNAELAPFSDQRTGLQADPPAALELVRPDRNTTGFAVSVDAAGDFNGDGIDDLVIGEAAPGGRVHVVFGAGDLAAAGEGRLDLADLDGQLGFTLAGGPDFGGFGARVAGIGDFDGDGLDDLAIHEDRATAPGRVFVVFGTAASLPGALDLARPAPLETLRINGLAPGDRLGAALAGPGDVNGDGRDDLLLGAPGLAVADAQGNAVAGTGQVVVLFGRAGRDGPIELAALQPADGYRLAAPAPGIGFGAALDGAGDFDGDGIADLVVAAPGMPIDGIDGAGQAWIISGALRPDSTPPPPPPVPTTALALDGVRIALPFGDSVFVQFDVSNTGAEAAQAVELEISAPAGYSVTELFRLAPGCTSASGSGEVRCDAAAIAAWQCDVAADGAFCALAELPAGGSAAVLVELAGQGAADASAATRAANAAETTANVALEP